MNSTTPSSLSSLGFRYTKCRFGDCKTQEHNELNNAVVSVSRFEMQKMLFWGCGWTTLVSDWSSVCVSTFIGRGVSGGGVGGLFTVHSKPGYHGYSGYEPQRPETPGYHRYSGYSSCGLLCRIFWLPLVVFSLFYVVSNSFFVFISCRFNLCTFPFRANSPPAVRAACRASPLFLTFRFRYALLIRQFSFSVSRFNFNFPLRLYILLFLTALIVCGLCA